MSYIPEQPNIYQGKQAIINSPILNFEITQRVSVGMFVKYQMAAFLGIFAITMLVQFVSYYFISLSDYLESTKKMKELRTYGKNFGLIFQATDDLLDYTGKKRILGKSGMDARRKTSVSVYC